MNAARSIYQKNQTEPTASAGRKQVRVFNGYGAKRITITDDTDEGKIRVNHFSDWDGNFQIKIYGQSGYEVYSRSYLIKPGQNQFKIELNGLNDGIFIVETSIRNPREGLLTTYNKIELRTKNT